MEMEMEEATKDEETEVGVDLISELPDSLLHHILSFLDMTYVFQTSFLSRRWRYVWTYLPILNLDANVYNRCLLNPKSSCMGIHNFVDRLLYVRDQKSHIQAFRFLATDKDHDDHQSNSFYWDAAVFGQVYTWIHVLVRQKVKELDLQVGNVEDSFYHAIRFPNCLFTCQSLTTLTLGVGRDDYPGMFNLTDEDDDDLARIMSLPALKTLHLKSFKFCIGKKTTQNLFSSSVCCPVLETLIISCCIVEKSSCHEEEDQPLTISALQLKNLIIIDECEYPNYGYSRIEVFAPKLTSFRCRDTNLNDYSFVDISSLMNAEIETIYGSHCYKNNKWKTEQQQLILMEESYIDNVIKCLGAIRNVRSLVLSTCLLEDVYNFHNGGAHFEKKERVHTIGLGSLLKEFWNLSFLKLRTSFSRNHYRVIKYLLEKCPNLETLVFERAKLQEDECSKPKKYEFWDESWRWQCKLHHLKVVEIHNIIGCLDELKFLQFLLMDIDAVVLEKVVVYTSGMKETTSDFTAKTFMEELLKSPRPSSLTKISSLLLFGSKDSGRIRAEFSP